MWILWDLLLSRLLLDWLLHLWLLRCLETGDRIESSRGLLLRQRIERGSTETIGVCALWALCMRKRIVRASRLWLHSIKPLLRLSPGVVATCIDCCVLLLNRLLLLLSHGPKAILLSPRIVCVESSLLWLQKVLLRLLLRLAKSRAAKASLLGLLLKSIACSIRVLISSHLGLHTKSSILLLRVDHISKPIDCRLLLVALVPACRLRDRGLGRCIVE